MTQETSSLLERTRKEALRALVGRAGLSPRQIATLKLDQLHLAQSTLTVEPDAETAPPHPSPDKLVTVKLDSETQRTLLAWLVVRPDSPNEHLFPGAGMAALDPAAIQAALTAESEQPAETRPETPAAPGAPQTLPEPVVPLAAEAPAVATSAEPEVQPTVEPAQSATLQEIEALRRELAQAEAEKAPPKPTPPAPVRLARPAAVPGGQPEAGTRPTPKLVTPRRATEASAAGVVRQPAQAAARPDSRARSAGAARQVAGAPTRPPIEAERRLTIQLSYRAMTVMGIALALICCAALAVGGYLSWQAGGVTNLVAQVFPAAAPTQAATPTTLPVSPVNTPTPLPSPTFTPLPPPTPLPTDTPPGQVPVEPGPTPTPIIIVVTATPVPETETPTPTPTEAATEAATPPPTESSGGEETPPTAPGEEETQPAASSTEEEATATPTPGFKYQAPVLLEPENNARVQDRLLILKWEPIWTMEPGEYFAVRLRFKVQGAYEYAGDQVNAPEWRLPDILYYKADGPELQYEWWVYVERKNADGSTTQLSPESEHRIFSWY